VGGCKGPDEKPTRSPRQVRNHAFAGPIGIKLSTTRNIVKFVRKIAPDVFLGTLAGGRACCNGQWVVFYALKMLRDGVLGAAGDNQFEFRIQRRPVFYGRKERGVAFRVALVQCINDDDGGRRIAQTVAPLCQWSRNELLEYLAGRDIIETRSLDDRNDKASQRWIATGEPDGIHPPQNGRGRFDCAIERKEGSQPALTLEFVSCMGSDCRLASPGVSVHP